MAELTHEQADEKLDEDEISDTLTPDNADDNADAGDEGNDDVDDDESVHSEDSDYDGDIDDDNKQEDEINNETCALFLQQLWEAQRVNIQKRKQDQFLPLTKKFVNASFIKREKMLNDHPAVVKHLVFYVVT